MNSISLDFNNNMICIMNERQQGTEFDASLDKSKFNSFIPLKYRENSSFTWNFENETFTVNQDYLLHDGCVMTSDCFIPQLIVPMKGLKKRRKELLEIMNYEDFNLMDEIPEGLRKFFGM